LNGDFASPLLNRGFDWKVTDNSGIGIARTQDGGSALSLDFSGREAESCELLSHPVALEPGALYVMHFDYRTVDLSPHTGVSWRLGTGSAFALDASADWKRAEWQFRAVGPRNLKLIYQRIPGSTRAEGRLFLRNARIELAAPIDSPPGADKSIRRAVHHV
jgi:hypothetical protein